MSVRLDILEATIFCKLSLEGMIILGHQDELVNNLYDSVNSLIKTAWPVMLLIAILLFLAI